jgi:hypothetical protein
VSDGFLTRQDVEDALRDLVAELVVAGIEATVRVVGGAAVAQRVHRPVLTDDIDALHHTSPEFTEAVQRVAKARNWPDTWLNDGVKMFESHFDTDADWELRFTGTNVSVYIARPELLLAMKLLAGRGKRDSNDIDLLLDSCGVTSVAQAQAIFAQYYRVESIKPAAMRQLQARFSD